MEEFFVPLRSCAGKQVVQYSTKLQGRLSSLSSVSVIAATVISTSWDADSLWSGFDKGNYRVNTKDTAVVGLPMHAGA